MYSFSGITGVCTLQSKDAKQGRKIEDPENRGSNTGWRRESQDEHDVDPREVPAQHFWKTMCLCWAKAEGSIRDIATK